MTKRIAPPDDPTPQLGEMVHNALESAVENGYGSALRSMSLDEQVRDLREYDADLEMFSESAIRPYVERWRSGSR